MSLDFKPFPPAIESVGPTMPVWQFIHNLTEGELATISYLLVYYSTYEKAGSAMNIMAAKYRWCVFSTLNRTEVGELYSFLLSIYNMEPKQGVISVTLFSILTAMNHIK